MAEEEVKPAATETPAKEAPAPKAEEKKVSDPAPDKADAPKAEAEKKAELEKKETAEQPPKEKTVAPEKYDLKLSEDSVLGKRALERIEAYAKEQGLSNEQAQAIVDGEAEAVAKFVDEQSNEWANQTKNDKEIGGEGFKKNVETAKRVIDKFGSDTLRKELNKTGYGNHPELIRLLSRIGKAMNEDELVIPGAQAGTKRSREEIFYGKEKV